MTPTAACRCAAKMTDSGPVAAGPLRHETVGMKMLRTLRWMAGLVLGLVAATAAAQESMAERIAACEAVEHSDPARALAISEELLATPAADTDIQLRIEILGCRAWALLVSGDRAGGLALVRQILAHNEAVSDPLDRVRNLRRVASLYQRGDEVETAIGHIAEALELAERHDFTGEQVGVLTNLGVLHSEARNFDRAIDYYRRALELAPGNVPPGQELPIRFNLALTYRNSGRLDEALELFDDLAARLDTPGMEVRLASTLNVMASIHRERGALDRAEALLARAEALHESLENPAEHVAVLLEKAQVLAARGDHADAVAVAEEALAKARRADYYFSIRGALDVLAEVLEGAGRPAEALAYQREHGRVTAQHLREQQGEKLLALEAQLGNERQARELAELRRERDLQEMRLAEQRRNQRLLVAAGIVLILAGVVALALQRRHNRRLAHISRTDLLTGLPNRRGISEHLASLEEGGGVLILVDLDHFKRINDNHGHDRGDQVLRRVAESLQARCRDAGARVGRWGGEEFLVFLPNADAGTSAQLADRLCRAIAALEIPGPEPEPLRVTASAGFAPLDIALRHSGQEGWEPALLIADQLLFRAKRAGRDRWFGVWPNPDQAPIQPRELDAALAAGQCRLLRPDEGPAPA